MADFDVAVLSGSSLQQWVDPVGPSDEPSRINPNPEAAQLYNRATVGVEVSMNALVGGVLVTDAGLGGRLFSAWMVEWPSGSAPPVTQPIGGTSANVRFTPTVAGHYTLAVRRPAGGAVLLHFDAALP